MTEGLNTPAVRWLTFLVYGLIVVLTIMTGWHQATIGELPDNYVRLERYQSDNTRIEQGLRDINQKLDALMIK